jgi:hypothetical protein
MQINVFLRLVLKDVSPSSGVRRNAGGIPIASSAIAPLRMKARLLIVLILPQRF